eukprot:m.285020 g.285020  ORF g.285020 m.285020 type:complete len:149 (-) comp19914_c0_seq12:2286-2732(-)
MPSERNFIVLLGGGATCPHGLLGLWLDGKLYRFATYTGAMIEKLTVHDHGHATVVLRSAQHRLVVDAYGDYNSAPALFGPVPGGGFVPFVHEMLGATVVVTLERRSDGRILFHGMGTHAGLEIESVASNATRARGKLAVIRSLLSSNS